MKSRSWLFVCLFSLTCLPASAILTVTTTSDAIANDGQCSLREAIGASNGLVNECGSGTEIRFNIPGGGVQTIQIASALPDITNAIVVDGFTQPGASSAVFPPVLRIQLQPAPGSSALNGLTIGPTSNDTIIRGLVINGFAGAGILVQGRRATVFSNFLGTDPTGMVAMPNSVGVMLLDTPGSFFGTVWQNFVSGNSSSGVVIQGGAGNVKHNWIGLASDGVTPLGNGGDGVRVINGTGVSVGGLSVPNTPNTIGYNGGAGINVLGTSTASASDNVFYNNGGLDFDLNGDGPTANDSCDTDSGPNSLLNKPVSLSVSSGTNLWEISGQLDVPPGTYNVWLYRVDGSARRFLTQSQSITVANQCAFNFTQTFDHSLIAPGTQLYAFVRNQGTNEQSEFFGPITVSTFGPPAITSVSPARGTHLGGTLVTVTGGPFDADASLRFDGVPVSTTTVVNSTTIQGRTPPHAPAIVDVTVVESRGTATAPGAYRYDRIKAKNDMGADGFADLFFRNSTDGRNKLYVGEANQVFDMPTASPASLIAAGVGDFDADDRADILWRDPSNGSTFVWLMQMEQVPFVGLRPVIKTARGLPTVENFWEVKATGDVDGDNDLDVIWRNANDGTIAIWLLQNGEFVSGAYVATVPEMQVRGAGDLNGDGKADIVFRNPTNGDNAVWLMNGTTIASGHYLPNVSDLSLQIVSIADMNNDDMDDIVWRNSSTGVNAVWFMNGATISQGQILPAFSQSSILCSAADFANDSRPDLFFRNPATGVNQIMPNPTTGDGTTTAAPTVEAAFTCFAQ